jgi:MFS family permease
MPVAIDGGGLPLVSDAAGAKQRSHEGVVTRAPGAPGRARKPRKAAPATEERTATFGEVLASREYKAVFSASALSWFGDYAARAAVTALVFQQTNSIAASAATFAISYLPWLGFGAVLSAIAERHSYRRVMVICDIARLLIMATIAMLHLPVPALMGLLFVTALLNPPFDAARSAMLPQILDGDRYVVGLSLQRTVSQVAMIGGYIGGAAFTAADPRGALYFNAATFGFSAVAIWFFVRERPPSLREEDRSSLLRETVDGYSVVFRNRVLRAVALVVFGAALFGAVPEGLAAAWSHEFPHEQRLHGWFQGAIMMAGALGFILGTLVVSRLVSPARRIKLIRPFAILTPLTLVPTLFQPGFPIVVAMTVASGIALAGMLPATNGLFVQVLPPSYRARAFGVIQSGLYLLQGASVTIAGWLASHYNLEKVVGMWAIGGVVLMVMISLTWPSSATISDAILANRIRTAAEEHAGLSVAGQEFGEDTIDLGRPSTPLRRMGPPFRPAPSYFERAESTVDLSTHLRSAPSDPTVDLTARRAQYRRAAARTPEKDHGQATVDLGDAPPATGKHRQ